MNKEIEYRFLVNPTDIHKFLNRLEPLSSHIKDIEQFYVSYDKERGYSARYRLCNRLKPVNKEVSTTECWFTQKMKTEDFPYEVEHLVSPELYYEIKEVMQIGESISKTRYQFDLFEIDVFHDIDLVILEMELSEPIENPELLLPKEILVGCEVTNITGDFRYSNVNMALKIINS